MNIKNIALSVLVICALLALGGCGTFELGIEPTPTATPGVTRYANTDYGFAFQYPSHWTLEDQTDAHMISLTRDTLRLRIGFKRASEPVEVWQRSGLPAGELVYQSKVRFLDQVVPGYVLLYERKAKMVLYNETTPVQINDMLFYIELEDANPDYQAIDIPDATVREVEQILVSFERIPATTAPTSTPAPTATPQPSPTVFPPPQDPAQGEDTPELQGPVLGEHQVRTADDMTMVYVPGGAFPMGSDDDDVAYAVGLCTPFIDACQPESFQGEQPVHTVTLDSFWIDQTEVSNAQFGRCVEAGVCQAPMLPPDAEPGAPDWPVGGVFWEQAQTYCTWVGGRLPTEAEWEYAARGPEGYRFPWGDEFDGTRLNYCDLNCGAAWGDESIHGRSWADETVDDGYAQAAPVGSYPAGASWCGALDMAGNVWEWVSDGMRTYTSDSQVNPLGPEGGTFIGVRGGSWRYFPHYARSANRIAERVAGAGAENGFRCVVPATP